MHPIEHLRHVARAGLVEPGLLAREAAAALLPCTADPAELVVACRRLLDRHPAAGPLWWVTSTALTAAEPRAALVDALRLLDADATDAYAAEMRAEGPACVVRAWALGPRRALVTTDGLAEIEVASTADRSVWLVAGVGTALPERVYDVASRRALESVPAQIAEVRAQLVTGVIGTDGPVDFHDAAHAAPCPVAPELLGRP